jgi:hypothetical protein
MCGNQCPKRGIYIPFHQLTTIAILLLSGVVRGKTPHVYVLIIYGKFSHLQDPKKILFLRKVLELCELIGVKSGSALLTGPLTECRHGQMNGYASRKDIVFFKLSSSCMC